ncbi:MAG: PDZ domain-containing protein [Planctomycetes bacterium]|nr:PDZ domain-containing protein [Planctomycetota bacterium]
MKRLALATNLTWGLNFVAAFGIFLFAFVFILFPPRRPKSEYAKLEKSSRPPAKKEEVLDRGRFAPVWAQRLGDVTVKATAGPSGLETKVEVAGVMKATERKKSLAFVNILSGGEQQRVKEGDSVLGARVKEIRSASVVFDDGGKEIELFTKRAALNMKVVPGKKPVEGSKGTAPGDFKTKKTGETAERVDWELDARELDYATKNLDTLLGQVKLRPYAVEGGEMAGLAIDEVTPGSLAAERGFLNGDVVKAVDGQVLASVEDLKKMASAPGMEEKDSITITVERSGRKIEMVFKVTK